MKKNAICSIAAIFAAVLLVSVMSACQTPKTSSYGLPDVGYLQFTSSSKYSGGVTAVIDGKTTIDADVNSAKGRVGSNDHTYSIKSGTHSLEVYDSDGSLILRKQIFVSAQETRTVVLP